MANGATGAVTDNRTVGMTTKTVPTQHFSYLVEIQALFAEIDAISDNAATPTYMNPGDMIKALQGLYISELLGLDEDSADEERRNDNDISLMEGSATNRDYTLGGSESLQSNLGDLIEEYSDIFSNSVKGHTPLTCPNGVSDRHAGMRNKPQQSGVTENPEIKTKGST